MIDVAMGVIVDRETATMGTTVSMHARKKMACGMLHM